MTDYNHAQDQLLMDLDPEVFNNSVIFPYMTKGSDIYHEFMTYVLRQSRIFSKFSCALVQNSYRPETDELLQLGLESRCDFVHVVDCNVGLRHDTTARLMANDLDIVASPLYFYDPISNDIYLNVHYSDELLREYSPRMPDGGVEEIFSTALGSVLIKHRVLETFSQADESFCRWTNFLDEKHRNCSPDTIFFLKCREFGFQIHMDWRIPLGTYYQQARFNSSLAEKFYVQRWFDVTFGPDAKNELFKTTEGRDHLKSALQHHYTSGLAGRDPGGGAGTDQSEAQGETTPNSGDAVREVPDGVHGTVGAGAASAAEDTGINS